MAEFWRCFGRLPGAVMHDEPDLLWFATGVPDGSLNGVIHSQFADGEAASRIDETVGYFERRRLPMQWWVGPSSRPADLGGAPRGPGFGQQAVASAGNGGGPWTCCRDLPRRRPAWTVHRVDGRGD